MGQFLLGELAFAIHAIETAEILPGLLKARQSIADRYLPEGDDPNAYQVRFVRIAILRIIDDAILRSGLGGDHVTWALLRVRGHADRAL